MPKVSIIVPIYNVENYLGRCLNSIINQTLREIEIICIDDGSQDNSSMILDEYSRSYNGIIKAVHVKNGGVAKARNIGLRLATGDYVGFVDSDDYISNDMFSILYQLAIKESADIVQCCHKSGSKNLYRVLATQDDIMAAFMNFELTNSVWDKLYKRATIADVAFPEDLKFAEDFEFNAKVFLNAKKIIMIPSVLYFYEERESSETHSMINNEHLKGFRVYDYLKEKSKNKYIGYRETSESLRFLDSIIGHDEIDDSYVNDLICRIKKASKDTTHNPFLSKIDKIRCFFVSYFPLLCIDLTKKIKKIRSFL